MTTACAWCGAITGVDLVQLALRGVSHGVCLVCMPVVFGERAFLAYLDDKVERLCEGCANFAFTVERMREISYDGPTPMRNCETGG